MFVSLLAAGLLGLAPHSDPCKKALPRGPAVPAAIILRTTCGDLRLATDGRLSRLRRRWLHDWLAAHPEGPRWGREFSVRRNRPGLITVLRGKDVVWRSRRLYPNDAGDLTFGPFGLAFASYRHGIFLTDLHGPERLVVRRRGQYPAGFTGEGELFVTGSGVISLVGRDGSLRRRFRYRQRNAFAFDERTDTLYFVTPRGELAAAHGARLDVLRQLRSVDGALSIASPELLLFSGERSLVVTHRDGSVVASARWAHGRFSASDSGVSVAPDGRSFAFRLSDARPGARSGKAMVYLLRAGEKWAHPVYWDRLGPSGCALGAALSWHGAFLLYRDQGGELAIVDSRGGAAHRLRSFVRSVPGIVTSAFWAAEFGR